MNQILKIIIAIFGGVDTVFNIALPTLVALLWISFQDLIGLSSYILLIAGIMATIFRGIKVGWLK